MPRPRSRTRTFWTNTGFDPVGIVSGGPRHHPAARRGASTITQQLVRARLLPGRGVRGQSRRSARSRRSSSRSASPRPTPARRASSASSPPTSTRTSTATTLRRAAAAIGYFGKNLDELTLAQARSSPPSPSRPRYDLVRNAVTDGDGTIYALPADAIVVASARYILELMASDASVLTAARYTPRSSGPERRGRSSSRSSGQQRDGGAALRVVAARGARQRLCAGPRPARSSSTAACASLDARLEVQQSAEKWVTAAMIPPRTTNPRRPTQGARGALPPLDAEAARATRSTTARSWPWTYQDGRDRRLRRVGGLLHRRQVSRKFSRSSTSWPMAGASLGRPSSRSTTSPASMTETMTASTMFMDVTTVFAGATRPPKPPARARPGRDAQRAPVVAQHPGGQGRARDGIDHVFERPSSSA